MNIVLADDHELMRRGVRDLLAANPDWHIAGEAGDGDEAVRLISELQPDVAILDFSMPLRTGPEVAIAVAPIAPNTRIIILTMHDSDATLRTVIECGAYGYVLKGEADVCLIEALRTVSQGRRYLHPRAEESLRQGFVRRHPHTTGPDTVKQAGNLTDREREIVSLLASGLSSKEAATKLDIGTRTVETHRLNIYRKMQFSTIADLVRYAVRQNLVSSH